MKNIRNVATNWNKLKLKNICILDYFTQYVCSMYFQAFAVWICLYALSKTIKIEVKLK